MTRYLDRWNDPGKENETSKVSIYDGTITLRNNQ
jgi:hypothetical protein